MSNHPTHALEAYLDGELDGAERLMIEAHLASCPACMQHLEEARAVRGLLAAHRGAAPAMETDEFWAQLAPLLPDRRARLGLAWAWGGVMLAAAVFAQVLSAAIGVFALLTTVGAPPTAALETVSLWRSEAEGLLGHVGRGAWGWSISGVDPATVEVMLVVAAQLVVVLVAAAVAVSFLSWVIVASTHCRTAALEP